ncbi:MAG: hypothetical protein ABSH34_25955 [Verrucomicrobiota bacterium]|jgi:hypothetical protein
MKLILVPSFVVFTLLASLAGLSGATDQPGDPKPGSATAPSALTVGGERLSVRKVIDHKLNDAVAFTFSAPEKWRDSSQVFWEFGNINMPATIAVKAENPGNEEAFFMFEPQQFFTLQPDRGFYREGYTACKVTKLRPQPPVQALASFIKQARAQVSDLKFVGSKDLPDLPKSMGTHIATNQRGVGVKVTYELNNKPVEEEFYAVYYLENIPAGRGSQINWGLGALHSFRAPLGSLDRRREVFCAIAKSFRGNPQWFQRAMAIKQQLIARWQAQLKASYDSIAAAGRLSKQLTANSDAFLASVDRSLVAARNPGGATAGSEPRSSADKQDDYIRGVDTVADPTYGTSQHSLTEQYHWTDGYGNYRNSNDANYDPNKHENGDWQLMPLAR